MKSYETLIEMGRHLEKSEETLCLLGLGSMADTKRLDQYSDIDFFLIVKDGYKKKYLCDLSWMNQTIIYSFMNTKDGYKVLFDNDVFAEFAVFESFELEQIPFDKGKVIFAKEGFDLNLIQPKEKHIQPLDVSYNINEALTNLYIGLSREKRGEKASAFSYIQVYAVSLVMPLFAKLYDEKNIAIDPFSYERRIEFRHNEAVALLAEFKQGYLKNKESAQAILEFLNTHFDINQPFYKKIMHLIEN